MAQPWSGSHGRAHGRHRHPHHRPRRRITLTRERALNALSYRMCLDILAALDAWAEDPEVAVVVIDAAGERAFCAGGDIQEMYETGTRGDYGYGRRFWADEYRMNDRIAEDIPKPVVSLMQGYIMGGGVGLGCHAARRWSARPARSPCPKSPSALVPDVGGTALLAAAPGCLGEYLHGVTAARMGPGRCALCGLRRHLRAARILARPGRAADALGRRRCRRCPVGGSAAWPHCRPAGQDRHAVRRQRGRDRGAARGHGQRFRGGRARRARPRSRRWRSPARSPASARCARPAAASARRSRANTASPGAPRNGDFLEGIRAKVIDKDGAPPLAARGPRGLWATTRWRRCSPL
ncbi:MAG: enoyl-CoA hydratase/isomerase family protein [Paracoccaceae bacterium]